MDVPRLLVLGGSQGARQINQAMPEAAVRLIARLPALSILHQAGARNLEETRAAYGSVGLGAPQVEVVPFLDDVAGAMAASHLLVSRAGAITLAEICAAGRPSLLVPLAIPSPAAPNDENNNGNDRLPWYKRLGKISETALHDFTDITVFLILGALLAAFVRQVLSQDDIANLSTNYPTGSILAMMGLAVLLCLCSEADAFVAASFTTRPGTAGRDTPPKRRPGSPSRMSPTFSSRLFHLSTGTASLTM